MADPVGAVALYEIVMFIVEWVQDWCQALKLISGPPLA